MVEEKITFKTALMGLVRGNDPFGVIIIDEHMGPRVYATEQNEKARLLTVNLAQNQVLSAAAKSDKAHIWNIYFVEGAKNIETKTINEFNNPRHLRMQLGMLGERAIRVVKTKANIFKESTPNFDGELKESNIKEAVVMGYNTRACVAACVGGDYADCEIPMSDTYKDGLIGRGITVHSHSSLLRGWEGKPDGWEKRKGVVFYTKFA